jgi:hypothetical protein
VRKIVGQRKAETTSPLFASPKTRFAWSPIFPRPPAAVGRGGLAGGVTALSMRSRRFLPMMAGKNGKTAIILTDGVDNASKLKPEEMAEILQQVSIPVTAG